MTKKTYQKAIHIAHEGGFGVMLDSTPVRTPAGTTLVVPSEGLARAIASEWDGQGETVVPATMPLMQLASTAIDRVGATRAAVIDAIAAYGASDLLCHRAEAGSDLATRQQADWQPPLDWLAATFGACLNIGEGIMPVAQPAEALDAVHAGVATIADDMALAGVAEVTSLLGSVVLALGIYHRHISAGDAWRLAHLDETFQEELWGTDPEAARHRAGRKEDFMAAIRFLSFLQS